MVKKQASKKLNIKKKELFRLKTDLGKKSGIILNEIPFARWLVVALITNLLIIILVILLKNKIPPEIPLFYGFPEGEEQLTTNIQLVLPSFFSVLVIITNTTISLLINSNFLKQILVTASLVMTAFSIITTVKIFFLVGGI